MCICNKYMDLTNNNIKFIHERSNSLDSIGSFYSFGSIDTISIGSNKERTSSCSDEIIYSNSETIPIKITDYKMTKELLNNDCTRRTRDTYLIEDTLEVSTCKNQLLNTENLKNIISRSPNPAKWSSILSENYFTCMQLKNNNRDKK